MVASTTSKSVSSNTRGAVKRVVSNVEDSAMPAKKAKVNARDNTQTKEALFDGNSSSSDEEFNIKAREIDETIQGKFTKHDEATSVVNDATKLTNSHIIEDLDNNPFVDKARQVAKGIDSTFDDLPALEPADDGNQGVSNDADPEATVSKGKGKETTSTPLEQSVVNDKEKDEKYFTNSSGELQGRMIATTALFQAVPPLSLNMSDSESTLDSAASSSPTPSTNTGGEISKAVRPAIKDNNEFIFPEFVPESAQGRIMSISMGSNGLDRFPISRLPLSAKWGRSGSVSLGQEDRSRYLTVYGITIRLTIPGKVVSCFFYDSDGQPQPRVTIGISPLRMQDKISYNALINHKSNPILTDERDIIYAARLQRQRVRDQPAAVNQPYMRVFDMQSGPTKKRNPKSASMIAKNDIVMLECNVTRYKPSIGSKPKRSSKDWDTWNVALELVDIIYLYQAPDTSDRNSVIVVEDDEDEEY